MGDPLVSMLLDRRDRSVELRAKLIRRRPYPFRLQLTLELLSETIERQVLVLASAVGVGQHREVQEQRVEQHVLDDAEEASCGTVEQVDPIRAGQIKGLKLLPRERERHGVVVDTAGDRVQVEKVRRTGLGGRHD